jgi:hypothetical protein
MSDDVSVATNDVGLLTLPGSRGTIALAVLMRGSNQTEAAQNRIIADLTRTVIQHWNR